VVKGKEKLDPPAATFSFQTIRAYRHSGDFGRIASACEFSGKKGAFAIPSLDGACMRLPVSG
jgi:hypothetical protein